MRAPSAVLGGSRKLYWFRVLENTTCVTRKYLGKHLEGQNNDIKNASNYTLRCKCFCCQEILPFLVHFDTEVALLRDTVSAEITHLSVICGELIRLWGY